MKDQNSYVMDNDWWVYTHIGGNHLIEWRVKDFSFESLQRFPTGDTAQSDGSRHVASYSYLDTVVIQYKLTIHDTGLGSTQN